MAGGLDGQRQQVALSRLCGMRKCFKTTAYCVGIPASPNFLKPSQLTFPHFIVVYLKYIDLILAVVGVLIYPYDDVFTPVNARLLFSRRFLNPELWNPALYSLGHPAKLVNFSY